MRERFDAFALALHPEKTRLIEFGRYKRPTRAQRVRNWNLHCPGLHLHLRSDPAGDTSNFKGRPGVTVSGRSYREIKEELRRMNAPANPSSGILAEAGRNRPLRLLRSPYECPSALRVLASRDRPPGDERFGGAARSDRLHVGPKDAITAGRPRTAHPSSLARPALRRQTPEVGAGCSNWARPDLCGGCSAMSIPTAILDPKHPFKMGPMNGRKRRESGLRVV